MHRGKGKTSTLTEENHKPLQLRSYKEYRGQFYNFTDEVRSGEEKRSHSDHTAVRIKANTGL